MIPRTYSIRRLKEKARQNNIYWVPSGGKGGHGVFRGPDNNDDFRIYPLPSSQHKKEVTRTYLKGFLRRFGLTEEFFDD